MPYVLLALAFSAATVAPAVAADPSSAQRYAVVVGVNQYNHGKLPPLRYAVNDAAEVAAVFTTAGYKTRLLTDDTAEKPTKANVESALRDTLAGFRKGDTVVVAFAGHGLQFQGQKDAYFCPADAKPFPDATATLVSLGGLYRDFERADAGVKVLLVDACRDDPSASRGADADSSPRPPRGVAALFSCAAGERAYEHEQLKHGVYFHHVITGLRGAAKNSRGEVTFNSLADYTSAHVTEQVPTLIGDGARQSPNQKTDLTGASPVLVAEDRETAGLTEYLSVLGNGGRTDDWIGRMAARVPEWKAQADAGNAEAQFLLGRCLQSGVGVAKSETAAARRFRDAADQGLAAAQFNYALCLAAGRGLKAADPSQAVEWYRKAARQGLTAAMCNLGHHYEHGLGVAKSPEDAVHFYRLAADQRHPVAQFNLAECYSHGRGVKADPASAVRLFRDAALRGHTVAQYNLAASYANGAGVKKDLYLARRWFAIAAAHGDADAQIALRQLPK